MTLAEKNAHWDFLNKQHVSKQGIYKKESPAIGLTNANEWGPVLWESFHNKTKQPIEAKKTHLKWFFDFRIWLPCNKCRLHYIKLLHTMPPDFSNQASLYQWGIKLHNAVNINLGKPIFPFDKNA